MCKFKIVLVLYVLYLCDLFSIFIMINNLMNTDTLVSLLIFCNMSYYFWMRMWMENVNNFQIAKVKPQGVA